jgi:hypothetical protein
MNHGTRVIRLPRRAWPLTTRAAAATIATAALALPAAVHASSGGGHTALLRSSATHSALAFSRCMRSHGVPNFPDPAGGGVIPKETPQQLGVGGSQFQAAERACQHLLPNGGQPTPSALRQSWSDFLKFARCMRRHGVSNWPDPSRSPPHPERPYFDLQRAGVDPNSPQVSTKLHACLPLLHGNNPHRLGQGGS